MLSSKRIKPFKTQSIRDHRTRLNAEYLTIIDRHADKAQSISEAFVCSNQNILTCQTLILVHTYINNVGWVGCASVG